MANWYAFGRAYTTSEAARRSATTSLRLELTPRAVDLLGLHMGYVDTAMAAHSTGP